LRQQRGLTLDNYLQTIQVSAEDFRADLRPRASERLTQFLVLNEVAQAEGVQVSPDEIEKEIERLSQPYGEQAETMKKILSSPASQSSLSADLLIRKTIEHLVAIARGEVPTEEDPTPGQQLETTVDGSSAPDETEEDGGRGPDSSDKASNDRKQ